MKKNLLIAAFALCAMSMNAQDIKVTPSFDDNGEPVFKFSAANDYYVTYLGEETKAEYAKVVPDNQYTYMGVDDASGRHLYVWDNTFSITDPVGTNSFGLPGEYMNLKVGTVGWSGLGYNIEKGKGLDMSKVSDDYTLHFAVKSTSTETFTFTFIDKNKGHEAKIVLGKTAGDGVEPLTDFTRDGEWYNIDIPLSYLYDQFGFSFKGVTDYSDVNSLAILAGGVTGTEVSYDAVMYYGPHATSGISSTTAQTKAANAKTYNLAGQQVSKDYKGIVIENGKKFIR